MCTSVEFDPAEGFCGSPVDNRAFFEGMTSKSSPAQKTRIFIWIPSPRFCNCSKANVVSRLGIFMRMQNKYPVFKIQATISASKEIECLCACYLWQRHLMTDVAFREGWLPRLSWPEATPTKGDTSSPSRMARRTITFCQESRSFKTSAIDKSVEHGRCLP